MVHDQAVLALEEAEEGKDTVGMVNNAEDATGAADGIEVDGKEDPIELAARGGRETEELEGKRVGVANELERELGATKEEPDAGKLGNSGNPEHEKVGEITGPDAEKV